jgi:thiamine-monophosphate kinase
MTETELVDWIRRQFPAQRRSGVVLGIGDDCAIFRQRGSSEDLLFTTDQCIEGVHFRPRDRADAVGHRALGRGLSDIAAMGGDPKFCLVSLTKPRSSGDEWVRRFYRGLGKLAGRWRVVLAGGDLASGRATSCDVVVCGSVPRGRALRRSGARPGDAIYVSGRLGGPCSRKYPATLFEPRLRLGRTLRDIATACIDVSDGLTLDLYRLCMESRVGAGLQDIPVAEGATMQQALQGGDEYELLFTADPGARVPGSVHRIGSITDEPGRMTFWDVPLEPIGYDHFPVSAS